MNFDLQEQHIAVQKLVRDFAQKEIAPVIARYDEAEEFPTDIIRKLGTLGIMGLPFPEKYGGGGADTISYVIALEELARVDSSVGITIEADVTLGGMPIFLYGTEEQKRRWLTPLAQGKTLGAFGLTEPSGGSDNRGMQSTASVQNENWVINGTKCFITNAGTEMSAFVTVAAVTGARPQGGKEFSTILVPTGTPGYSVSKPYKKMGWRASDTRELRFDDCRVPEANLIGKRGAGLRQFMVVLDRGRVAVAALCTGIAQGCLDLSHAYAKQRVAFGQSINKFQAIQFKLSDMAVNVELARLITYKAAFLQDKGAPFTQEAAMAKLFSSEIAVKAADEGLQIHGGYGFMRETPINRFYRDAKVMTIGEGTSEVLRMVIARNMGV